VSAIEAQDIRGMLGERKQESHKGDYGTVLIFGGSKGMEGAAGMAAVAALKSGAGKVLLAVPASTEISYSLRPEVMLRRIDDGGEGYFNKFSISQGLDLLEQADSMVIGPGFGRQVESELFFEEMLNNSSGPVVVDADGIYFLRYFMNEASWSELSKRWKGVITPHSGEAAALIDMDSEHIQDYRLEALSQLIEASSATVVLKGHNTLVSSEGEPVYFNETGNPGMATAGSGDVLSGIIGALLSRQDLDITVCQAAAIGVWIHGLSGDMAAERYGQTGMMAGDILNLLPEAWKSVLRY